MTPEHSKTVDIVCIGLANVDVVAHVSDLFINGFGVPKGGSLAVVPEIVHKMREELPNPQYVPGGCSANAACGFAVQGLHSAFIGMIGDDDLGRLFIDGFEPYDVSFQEQPYSDKMTGNCITLVTPDKERSFAYTTDTAAWRLGNASLDQLEDYQPSWVYVESFLAAMKDGTNNLFPKLLDVCSKNNISIAFNLAYACFVEDHLELIQSVIEHDVVKIVIGNRHEYMALFDVEDVETVKPKMRQMNKIFAVTYGERGSYAVHGGEECYVPAHEIPEDDILDTIGAGDQFAAGFVSGIIKNETLEQSCRRGADAGADILVIDGARPCLPEQK